VNNIVKSNRSISLMAMEVPPSLLVSFIAGGTAGLVVDVTTFPLDTFKTRLQGEGGFQALGGFSKLYKGIGPVILGSVPHSAIFFCTYDSLKEASRAAVFIPEFVVHMAAGSIGESVACLVGVPVEVVKQRRQVSSTSSWRIATRIWRGEGILGFYRGFQTTVSREVPFCLIQMPIWEWLKKQWGRAVGRKLSAGESAVCGSGGGVVAAVMTTPMDVAKTRIMLADEKMGACQILKIIYREEGMSGLFAGVLPRTIWVSVGGIIFFGVYEQMKIELCSR